MSARALGILAGVSKRSSMMNRSLLLIALSLTVAGCDSSESEAIRIEREQARFAREEVANALQREIDSTVQAEAASPIFPDNVKWRYRYEAQDHLSTLKGSVSVEIRVADVARGAHGLVISGTPVDSPGYGILLWLRLHGIPDSLFEASGMGRRKVTCIGAPTVIVPSGPHFEVVPISEDEVESQVSESPLVIELECTHYWLNP